MNNLDFLRTFQAYEENTTGQTQSTTQQGTTSTTTTGPTTTTTSTTTSSSYSVRLISGAKLFTGDPFEYGVGGDHWSVRQKGTQTWKEMTGKDYNTNLQQHIDLLDTRYPNERTQTAPKRRK
jgi:hypothetical protein